MTYSNAFDQSLTGMGSLARAKRVELQKLCRADRLLLAHRVFEGYPTDDEIEQHFNSDYNAKVTSKRDRKLEKNWGWLAAKHQNSDAEVDPKAHR